MASGNTQAKDKRVRRGRVQIMCEVETEGALEMLELPFVVGVMADLQGMPKPEDKEAFKERRFVPIDRDNFNDVLGQAAPRLAFRVKDRISGEEDQLMNVELNFKSMKDFTPSEVASQVPVLAELVEMRQKLTDLLSKMEGNDELENLLKEVLANTEKREEVAKALGQNAPGGSENDEKTESNEEKSE